MMVSRRSLSFLLRGIGRGEGWMLKDEAPSPPKQQLSSPNHFGISRSHIPEVTRAGQAKNEALVAYHPRRHLLPWAECDSSPGEDALAASPPDAITHEALMDEVCPRAGQNKIWTR